jgi:arsenate reductase
MFSDTFAGIAPSSAPLFLAAQILGGGLAVLLVRTLYLGVTAARATDVVIPHTSAPAGR